MNVRHRNHDPLFHLLLTYNWAQFRSFQHQRPMYRSTVASALFCLLLSSFQNRESCFWYVECVVNSSGPQLHASNVLYCIAKCHSTYGTLSLNTRHWCWSNGTENTHKMYIMVWTTSYIMARTVEGYTRKNPFWVFVNIRNINMTWNLEFTLTSMLYTILMVSLKS